MIISRTPLRVSFLGGGTDFPEFYNDHGGCVVTTTLQKYMYVIVNRRNDNKIRASYTRTEIVDHPAELQHPYIRQALLHLGLFEGIEVVTVADVPSSGSGLGASSALMVGLLKALSVLKGKEWTNRDLAHLAFHLEKYELGKSLGVQDHYSCALGGPR